MRRRLLLEVWLALVAGAMAAASTFAIRREAAEATLKHEAEE
jgi:hypothetical protein